MCGIVGYIGDKQAFPILIGGLRRLEYRGYDSAGVAMIDEQGELNVWKAKGKVDDLVNYCSEKNVTGTVGIAHTRWATHGEPSALNAHPHYSQSKNLAIIHNGIIENYADLKAKLVSKGITFRSDTDTEVLVQLIEYVQEQKNFDLLTAVQVALHEVIGAYAIALIDRREPNQIIAARKQSPLVVGIGDNEFFLGSDATPIVEYTDQVVYLEDGNIAVIRKGEPLKVVNIQNRKLKPEIQTVDLNLGQLEKGGYPHFMLKEIFEQPECLTNCMRGRVNVDTDNVVLSAVIDYRKQLVNAQRIIIVACGTSWHAALIGKQMIESLCRTPVEVEYASEFRFYLWHLQLHRFQYSPRHRYRIIYPRRTGDWCGIYQGFHGSGHCAFHAGTGAGKREGHHHQQRLSDYCEGTARDTGEDEEGVGAEWQDSRLEPHLYLCTQLPLFRAWV